jgi:hypothetical protein
MANQDGIGESSISHSELINEKFVRMDFFDFPHPTPCKISFLTKNHPKNQLLRNPSKSEQGAGSYSQ